MEEKELDVNSLFNKFKENVLSYFYMLKSEFQEVNILINELKNYKPSKSDVREATITQKALNIAVVISYARNFKRSFGFNNVEEINILLKQRFTEVENELHKKMITERDREFAHSDAAANDIQIYSEGIFSHSRGTIRQLLEKGELLILQEMVTKIRTEIDKQIKFLKIYK